jgi:hypothetical protein
MKLHNFEDFSIAKILSRVAEGLNEPLTIQWDKNKDIWNGSFSIDNKIYKIIIKNFSQSGHWLFKFTADDSFKLTNDVKKAFTVLPTIEKAAKDFIKEKDPEIFMFAALDKSIGRKKMYTKFSESISKEFNLGFYEKQSNDEKLFILHKNEYDGLEFSKTLVKIVNNREI